MMKEIMLEAFHLFLVMMAVVGIVCLVCVIAILLVWTCMEIKKIWHERQTFWKG